MPLSKKDFHRIYPNAEEQFHEIARVLVDEFPEIVKNDHIVSVEISMAVVYVLRTLRDEAAQLRAKANALVNKLREVHTHPKYISVWQVNQNHAGPYTGPQYSDELTALEAALKGKQND